MANSNCYSCNSCNSCNSCYSCKNLKMTEYNLFCFSRQFNDKDSFQQERYRAFNKVVGEARYKEILSEVRKIIPNNDNLKLKDFWKSVTSDQWKQLLAIPEAKDFKKGFGYISGVEINVSDKVKIVCEGKEVEISRESAIALGLLN